MESRARAELGAAVCSGPTADVAKSGLPHVLFSFDLAPTGFVAAGPRRYGLMLASRWPLEALDPCEFSVPWPERVLSAIVAAPGGPVEVHTTHVPPGASNGWIKIEHLEALRAGLQHVSRAPRVVCGDFNTPRRELPDGAVITWAQTEDGRTIHARGPRWDAAERSVIVGFGEIGLRTCFASCTDTRPNRRPGYYDAAPPASGDGSTTSSPHPASRHAASTTDTTGANRASATTRQATSYSTLRRTPEPRGR